MMVQKQYDGNGYGGVGQEPARPYQGMDRRQFITGVAAGAAGLWMLLNGGIGYKGLESIANAGESSVYAKRAHASKGPITDIHEFYGMCKDASDIMPHARWNEVDEVWFEFKDISIVTNYFLKDLYDQGGDGPGVRGKLKNQGKFRVNGNSYTFDYDGLIKFVDHNKNNINKVMLDRKGYLFVKTDKKNFLFPISPDFVKYYDAL